MKTHLLRVHWFYFIAAPLLAAEAYLVLSADLTFDRFVEAGLLFDLAVLIPCLHWLCYRNLGRQAVIRTVAYACLGVWIATKLVPESDHDLLTYVVPLRYAGIAVLVWIELAIGFAIFRTIFRGGSVSEVVSHFPVALPPWAVKLVAIEMSFWQKGLRAIKRLFGRR
jgi:hypothetical protein